MCDTTIQCVFVVCYVCKMYFIFKMQLHMFIHVYSDSIWFPFILDREGEVKEYMKPVFPKIGVKIGAFFLFMI